MAEYDLGTARGRIEIDSSGAETGALKAGQSVKQMESGFERASGTLIKAGAVMGGVGIAAVAGFGVAVNAAANFEQRISAIGAVTGASGKDLDQFRELALKLGADTKFSAGEAAGAIEELAKAGIPLPDIMKGAAAAVTDLAAAGEVDLARAAEITANSMNLFGISGERASHVADVFAQAANTSSAGVEDLGMALSQVGGVAKLVGLSFEDTINALSQMADAGYKGSDAGTSVKAMLLSLQPTTAKQIELFDKLGITTDGMNNKFFDAQGKLKPLVEIQKTLQEATRGMTDQQRTATLEAIGGTDAIRALGVMVGGTTEKTAEYGAVLNKEGAAQETAAKRMDNLKGSMEQLGGSFETALIKIGQLGQGPIRAVVDGITKMINGFMGLSSGTQQWIIAAVLGTGVLIGMLGAFILSVGAVMKLVVAYRNFKKALEIIKSIQLMTKAMTMLNASFLTNPVFLIIAGLVALGIALVILYKKSEAFRNIFKSIGNVFKEITGGFKAFVAAFKAGDGDITSSGFPGFMEKVGFILRQVFDFVVNNWPLLVAVFLPFIGIPLLIIRNWSTITDFFGRLPGIIGGFLLMLVTKALEFGVQFIGAFLSFLVTLPGKFVEMFAFIVGFMLGFAVRMVAMAVQFAVDFIAAVIGFLIALPGNIWDIFTTVISNTASWVVDMLGKAVDLGARFLNAIVEFFQQLPGRIWNFLISAFNHTVNWVNNMRQKAVEMGQNFLNSVVNFFQQLPGRVWGFLSNVASDAARWAGDMANRARQMGSDFFNGVSNGIQGLPGLVGGILGRVISAIKGAISNAFNAVRDFAASMWSGFKKGLGIGSPSLIEYAMWDLVDNVTSSTEDLRRQLLKVQKLAQLNFGEFGPTVMGQRSTAAAISEDDPRWDWRTMGNKQRGASWDANGNPTSYENADGTITTVPNTTFNNTFNTNADPIEISHQIMWDQRVRVRGAS